MTWNGIILGMGMAIGRVLMAGLNLLLGLVLVVGIGMICLNHWLLGGCVLIGGLWMDTWALNLCTRRHHGRQ